MKSHSYAELQCRSNFSFLEGASHPQELVTKAAQLGLQALALTDRHGVYGLPKAYKAACDFNLRSMDQQQKFKLISGAQLALTRGPNLTLLATNRQGYGLICRLLTASHEGQPKGHAELPWQGFVDIIETYPGRSGIIIIPQISQEQGGALGPVDSDTDFFETLSDFFKKQIYIPLNRFLDGHDQRRFNLAQEVQKRIGAPLVATNDVHYHLPGRRPLQDILTATRYGTTLSQAGTTLISNGERYLKSPQQMAHLFSDQPKALLNTVKIAEQCLFSLSELKYRYPSEWIPQGHTAQSFLENIAWKGAQERYQGLIPSGVEKQLNHELALIAQLGFADYFLTIWDIVAFAKEKKILCQGRGSAANSAVCFCLGITAIDPVRMNLLFERFISVERGEPPDIDVDFEHERREEVLQYVYEKYGRHRAAMVAAVITYQERSALRDVTRALNETAATPETTEVLCTELQEFPRHLSIHSGGFTLSADPLVEIVPVEPARMEGRTIVQWDKNDLDILGLLKVDLLSLGMLTALRKCLDLVNKQSPKQNPLTLATIPAEDKTTYDMICKADTIGVFQIESRAQMNMLPRLLPRNYYDLVVEIALVRPGPIHGEMVHPYLRRRQGLEPIDLPDPKLIPILGRTLGIPIFQEQIMKIAIVMAGFSAGESDELRRAIGAWRSTGSIDKMSMRLRSGLIASGLPEKFVEMMFQRMKGFSQYGFPESHSASFALLVYASSYLKCHHPMAFTCALLNSMPMGFYAEHTLVDDAKRHGVVVAPVHPQFSQWDCTIEPLNASNGGQTPGFCLRLGWRVVSGISRAEADRIIVERDRQPFSDLGNFLNRTQLRRHIAHQLAMGDAFQCFGVDQRQALWSLLSWYLVNQNFLDGKQKSPGKQLNLFPNTDPAENTFQGLTFFEAIQQDYQTYGLSVRGHPMEALRQKYKRRVPALTAENIKKLTHGAWAEAAGLVIARQRPPTAKGTVFSTLEDETGGIDLILHKETYQRYRDLFRSEPFLIAQGIIQRDRGAISLLVRKMRPLIPRSPEEPQTESVLRSSSHDWR